MVGIAYAQGITNRTAQEVAKPDIITTVLTQPWIYLVIVVAIIGIIYYKTRGKKDRPEEKPFFGVQVRKDMTTKVIANHLKVWGKKSKLTLFSGYGQKIGKVVKVAPVFKKKKVGHYVSLTKEEIKEILKAKAKKKDLTDSEMEFMEGVKEVIVDDDGTARKFEKKVWTDEEFSYSFIAFRSFGIIAYLKWLFLNRHETILIDPLAYTIDEVKKMLVLDPRANMIDHSGVWTLGSKKDNVMIDELNLQKDIENIKGFTADFLRRLSHEAPGQAISNERLSHESELREKERASRAGRYIGK